MKTRRSYALHGDDFDPAAIADWYDDEKEAFADLINADRGNRGFSYRELNRLHGFGHLEWRRFSRVLGIGSAFGDELLPLAENTDEFVVLEPSARFPTGNIGGRPSRYIAPAPSGEISFPEATFDAVVCLSVLHHIPNVSRVLEEMTRVLKSGGYMLLREPIVSMGDWRKPRPGLTKRERGIPLSVFREIINDLPLEKVHEGLCVFPVIRRLGDALRFEPYNSKIWTRIDFLLSRLTAWNIRYSPRGGFQRLMPSSVAFVLQKR